MDIVALLPSTASCANSQAWVSVRTPVRQHGRRQDTERKQISDRRQARLGWCGANNRERLVSYTRKAKVLEKDGRRPPGITQRVHVVARRDDKTWEERENGERKRVGLLSRLAKAASCTLAAGVLLFHTGSPAFADQVTLKFPAFMTSEVGRVHRTLLEAWKIIRETYVDRSFNQQDWDLLLQTTLADNVTVKSPEDAYSKIRSMLASLADPFTRIITSQEYESFKVNCDGALEGVGLYITTESGTGRLIVRNPIDGGPAARAGIMAGDELVQIDDEVMTGTKGEAVAKRLRGRAGTFVTLTLTRRSITDRDTSYGAPLKFKLQREAISFSPVYSTVLAHASPNGHLMKTGYIRLSGFPQNAAAEMSRAITLLKAEGAGSYILDLRNNPGGLLKSGLEVAEVWLDGDSILFNTIDREGYTRAISLVNGHSLTNDPLVVLVNKDSASASEIVAGALHENGRALLVGERTFGKGKIQSVSVLADGSALFVTVAKYLSPGLHQIDHVGLAPDLKCLDGLPGQIEEQSGAPAHIKNYKYDSDLSPQERRILELQNDSCVRVAEYELDKSADMM